MQASDSASQPPAYSEKSRTVNLCRFNNCIGHLLYRLSHQKRLIGEATAGSISAQSVFIISSFAITMYCIM